MEEGKDKQEAQQQSQQYPLTEEGKDKQEAQKQPHNQPEAKDPAARWGTHEMGPPSAPGAHPENQQAAQWAPWRSDEEHFHYVLEHTPVLGGGGGGGGGSPMESILDAFNSWTKKAESLGRNVWRHLNTSPSRTDAAWGKLRLTAKAISEGGFESLYRATFPAVPGERLVRSFACYLSTASGPVAGTMYLSTANVGFCSDRPLSFRAPSGEEAWSYYRVMVPLEKVERVEAVAAGPPPERYVEVVTVDAKEFWFMGFVSYDKAVGYLHGEVSRHRHGYAAAAAAPMQ